MHLYFEENSMTCFLSFVYGVPSGREKVYLQKEGNMLLFFH